MLRDRRAVILWLSLCATLVAAMVLVGGYTRLSGSGLSITQWKPIHGVIPPMNDAEWEEEFAAYRQSPQYEKINRGMSLDEFKIIYWPEYFHRLLARAIGIVFLLPMIVFALRGSLPRRLLYRLLGIFALGGLQGLMGWLMVASGLVDDPHVSHLRLAMHLSLAFAIFGMILYVILSERSESKDLSERSLGYARDDKIKRSYILWFSALCLQIILGAMVAGLHGGLVYNTWPDMGGAFVPADLLSHQPWVENPVFIQFLHRNLAVIVVIGFAFWWCAHREYVTQRGLHRPCAAVAAVLGMQFLLGVLTLINAVPINLAMMHQITALALFGAGVWLWHGLSPPHGGVR